MDFLRGLLNRFGMHIDSSRMKFEGSIFADGVIVPSFGGNLYFVDPDDGNDNRAGTTPDLAVATLQAAYNKCTAGQNDTVILIGNSSGLDLETALEWSKDYTHLIGICSPVSYAKRARIFNGTGNNLNYMLKISASGCTFANVYIFQGSTAATNEKNVWVTGGRNYFYNVHFAGMGHATPAGDADCSSLYLDGAEECTFEKCAIGVDTIERDAANSELILVDAANRNEFIECDFLSFVGSSGSGHLFVKVGSGGIDRFVKFVRCNFMNAIESTSTTMTSAMNIHDSAGGFILLKDCTLIGATDWAAADNGNVYVDGAAPTAGTSGIAVAATQ